MAAFVFADTMPPRPICLQSTAREMFLRSLRVEPTKHSLHIQLAFLLPPTLGYDDEILNARRTFEHNLDMLLDPAQRHLQDPPVPADLHIAEPLRSLEQTSKFYLQYHGMNDRPVQEKIAQLMRMTSPSLHWVAPFLLREQFEKQHGTGNFADNSDAPTKKRRLRIGFVVTSIRWCIGCTMLDDICMCL